MYIDNRIGIIRQIYGFLFANANFALLANVLHAYNRQNIHI